MRTFHVYIMASERRRLYIGVTGRLLARVWLHRHASTPGFTTRYRIDKLAHFEEYRDAPTAIAREKQLKSWRRERKERLVTASNPGWRDLSVDWLDHRAIRASVDPGCSAWRKRRS